MRVTGADIVQPQYGIGMRQRGEQTSAVRGATEEKTHPTTGHAADGDAVSDGPRSETSLLTRLHAQWGRFAQGRQDIQADNNGGAGPRTNAQVARFIEGGESSAPAQNGSDDAAMLDIRAFREALAAETRNPPVSGDEICLWSWA